MVWSSTAAIRRWWPRFHAQAPLRPTAPCRQRSCRTRSTSRDREPDLHHEFPPVGTRRMGCVEDPLAVANNALRLKGMCSHALHCVPEHDCADSDDCRESGAADVRDHCVPVSTFVDVRRRAARVHSGPGVDPLRERQIRHSASAGTDCGWDPLTTWYTARTGRQVQGKVADAGRTIDQQARRCRKCPGCCDPCRMVSAPYEASCIVISARFGACVPTIQRAVVGKSPHCRNTRGAAAWSHGPDGH
jgi:hypothetical protein